MKQTLEPFGELEQQVYGDLQNDPEALADYRDNCLRGIDPKLAVQIAIQNWWWRRGIDDDHVPENG